jgi:hypothetical protein
MIGRMPHGRPPEVSITLSPDQVRAVIRAATPDAADSLAARIARGLHAQLGDPTRSVPAGSDARADDARGPAAPSGGAGDGDRRLSQSLLRGLSVLACFAAPPGERGVVELAAELGISPSTAHRYTQTLLELGLLERAPAGRKYRLPAAPTGGGGGR